MEKLTVLLICGAGMSSGFMATSMRKAAKARGLEVSIIARSEAEVENYADEADFIMLGPHLASAMEEVERQVQGRKAKVFVMDKSYYSTLDGAAAIEALLHHAEQA